MPRRKAQFRIPDNIVRTLISRRPTWQTPGYDLIKDVVDLHVHPESCDEIAYAKQATDAQMKALVFKSEMAPSVYHARLTKAAVNDYALEKQVQPVLIFGGIVLDKGVCGGINPIAVSKLIRAYPDEMKVIWMPVNDSASNLETSGLSRSEARERGIYILENGKVLPEVEEIINLIAESHLVLSCGHLSVEEMMALIDLAKSAGVESILVDHPCLEVPAATIDEQKEMARKGAFLNHAALEFDLFHNIMPPQEIAQCIKEVGPSHCTLCSDVGLPFMWNPVEAMRILIWYLRATGITKEEIDIMAKSNPSRILGL